MNLRSILACTDFSTSTDAVLSRAALLACEHAAMLKLIYVPPANELPCPDAACRLSHHALQLTQRHGIRVRTVAHVANTLDDVARAAQGADLVVTGTANERSLRAFALGQPEMRLVRKAHLPVLSVRGRSDSAYQRLLVAVDFSEASRNLTKAAFGFSKSGLVELFHAIGTANDARLHDAEVSDRAIRAYRHECRRYAQERMFWLTDSTDARRNRVYAAISHGDPARQASAQQKQGGADLVVVGKRTTSGLSDFVFGSVAERLLRLSSVDVLVVPHDLRQSPVREHGGEPQARRRVRAGSSPVG